MVKQLVQSPHFLKHLGVYGYILIRKGVFWSPVPVLILIRIHLQIDPTSLDLVRLRISDQDIEESNQHDDCHVVVESIDLVLEVYVVELPHRHLRQVRALLLVHRDVHFHSVDVHQRIQVRVTSFH